MAEVVIVPDEAAAGELVAGAVVDLIAERPDAVLGFATGSTPLSTYRALARSLVSNHARQRTELLADG